MQFLDDPQRVLRVNPFVWSKGRAPLLTRGVAMLRKYR